MSKTKKAETVEVAEVVEEIPQLNLAEEKEALRSLCDGIPVAVGAAETTLSGIANELIRMEGVGLMMVNTSSNAVAVSNFAHGLKKVLRKLDELGFEAVQDAIEQSKS